MKEPYSEGLAVHADPESCVGLRKGAGEALTGARAGRVLSRVKRNVWGADAVHGWRKAMSHAALWPGAWGPHEVLDPEHARNHLAREPGDPMSSHGGWRRGTQREA